MFGLIMGAVALGAAVIGGITSAVATSKQSKALEEQARANQAQVLKETEETVGDIRLEGGQFASMQKAMIGASGVSMKSGSPLATIMDTQQKIEKDISRVRQGGEFEAGQYAAQAESLKKTRPWQIGTSLFNTAYKVGSAGATFF
jgi:hypothetical protein